MPLTSVDLGSAGWTHSKQTGVRLPSVRGVLTLVDTSYFEPPTSVQAHLAHGNLIQIGAFCSISGGSLGNVAMGRYCSIAPQVAMGANEHPIDWLTTSRVTYQPELHSWAEFLQPHRMAEFRSQRKDPGVVARMTTIGNDVWMGQDVFVKAGVSVGDGAIVAARSVVTRDVDPYTIVAGIPARPLRSRFDEATIKRLLGVAWWRFSIFDIYDIDFRNVSAALDSIEKRLDEGSIQPFLPEKLTLASMGRILSSP